MTTDEWDIEYYVLGNIEIMGLDWVEQGSWKDDDELTAKQMDEVFDWCEERNFTVSVTYRLNNPDA